MSCPCRQDPTVLRTSPPPGVSPGPPVPPADDFPRVATRAEKLAELHQCLDFYRAQQEAKCRP